ncbi:hypothetical protein vBVpaMR16F_184 [Vibrio phage vB_VpaM_R16F]|nr:hypothetical protein vBVpaMR16F_184 [Vibrio phage vB_VpaM_R16F]
MNLFITLYTLLGVFVIGMVIVNLLLDNTFTKFQKCCMVLFPIHTVIIFTISWISYSFASYNEKKSKLCQCDGCKMSRDPNQGYQPCHNYNLDGGEK